MRALTASSIYAWTDCPASAAAVRIAAPSNLAGLNIIASRVAWYRRVRSVSDRAKNNTSFREFTHIAQFRELTFVHYSILTVS